MFRKLKKFSYWKFTTLLGLQFILLLVALRTLFPQTWANQLQAGAPVIILVFLGAHLFNCFAEWFFHRYVLHAVSASWLRQFATKHRHHHSLTAVRLSRERDGPDHRILNQYPIETEEQHENSIFPRWALLAFWTVFTPLLVGLQLLSPHTPVLLCGYAAVAWSLACYEIFHHIEHLPFEWWKRRIEHPHSGGVWKKIYGFHLMHHANVGCNEAISGFFGLPIADWLFRTYQQPKKLLLDGQTASARDFALPPPRRFVQRLDRLIRRRETELQRFVQ